jgi:hypothetical protein
MRCWILRFTILIPACCDAGNLLRFDFSNLVCYKVQSQYPKIWHNLKINRWLWGNVELNPTRVLWEYLKLLLRFHVLKNLSSFKACVGFSYGIKAIFLLE